MLSLFPRTLFSVLFFCTISSFAQQWQTYDLTNSVIPPGSYVQHVTCDRTDSSVYVFTFDTSAHLSVFNKNTGWKSYPGYDAFLDTITGLKEARAHNGVLWCFTSHGLKKLESGTWSHIYFPSGYSSSSRGMAIDKGNNVWVAAGLRSGISKYDGHNWTTYNKVAYPSFEQDYFITDIQVDDDNNIIWVATNCHLASGIYAIDPAKNKVTRYHYGDAKYQCAHSVAPGRTKTFVGTCNFSSIRILDAASGNYLQSLDAPGTGCVARMAADPANRDQVWVISDKKLILFTDTANYRVFDKANAGIDGFGNMLAHEWISSDSLRIWLGTGSGLYSYTYAAGRNTVAIKNELFPVFSISPNPVSSSLDITFPGAGGAYKAEVVDLTGKPVEPVKTQINGKNGSVDVTSLAPGIYFLLLSDGARKVTRRFVKAG